jgi:hypothetical protein
MARVLNVVAKPGPKQRERIGGGSDCKLTGLRRVFPSGMTLSTTTAKPRTRSMQVTARTLLGWTSPQGCEVGDFPVFEAGNDLALVFQEVPLSNGRKCADPIDVVEPRTRAGSSSGCRSARVAIADALSAP